ncbi:MAG: YjgP/YjgQ family permease [Pseudopedobacter saltans]|uniref:YjgP/YjgQ family permease n=1 Tax=Pseudopedobacter saltans TaxID=151895 RepID=A0A2W5EQB0_9SPHI|nr:MAG: YjgP/YjgQ family permease [Pseudopedobacter saltans]
MFKKLDTLILRAFVGPFVATFLIALFVLVMQFFWLYIDDMVGKGLDLGTIFKLIGYVAATCIPLALPLALLLSSIMTFGNLGESFELVAIKSAGIPLTRFMRPLLVVTIILSGVAFVFSNNIIPVVNLKMTRLKYDIITAKPAFDIKEGTFYSKLDGFVIKIGKKDKDNKTIHDVVIFEKNVGLQDNILIAKTGTMSSTPDKLSLLFVLKDGWRYEESGASNTLNTQFTRMGFKEYHKVLDLSSLKLGESNEEGFKSDPKMFTLGQLGPAIDSLHRGDTIFYLRSKIELGPYALFARYQDSSWTKNKTLQTKKNVKSYADLLSDSMKVDVGHRITNNLQQMKNSVNILKNDYVAAGENFRKYQIEWHRKFTLSAACLLLFLIGAPLGSIIRKGGLGTPLLFAIIFFVLFYLFNTIGEKIAKQGVVSAWEGMWLSSAVLLPIGAFLMVKALNDAELFSKEKWYRVTKYIRSKLGIKAKKKAKDFENSEEMLQEDKSA